MESNAPVENVSSHPLKHIMSLEWDDSNDVSITTKSIEGEDKPLKQKKKVRFSDTVEQTYVDSNDLESNISDSDSENNTSSQYEEFSVDDDNVDDEENSENKEHSELELELEKNVSLSDEGSLCDLKEPSSVNSLVELNAEVEKQILQFSFDTQNEESKKVTENKLAALSSDVPKLWDSNNEPGSFGTVSPEKKISKCDKKVLQKQSEKINELLNTTDLAFSNALQIKQAVWEAWSTVKKWEYITKKQERKKINENMDHVSKLIPRRPEATQQHQVTQKQVIHKRKRAKPSNVNKQNPLSNMQREVSKADKEESEMAFKSWKKQKEEILKQDALKRQNDKLQTRMSSLMDKEIKKERAESAYIEWKMKKMHITKEEKEKKAWLMQIEDKVNEQKLQRDKEAQEIFQEWLERKYFQAQSYSIVFHDRPPWLPPGHS